MCRSAKPSKTHSAEEGIPGWDLLEYCEQEALLLVDVLQESYQKVARIISTIPKATLPSCCPRQVQTDQEFRFSAGIIFYAL